LEAADHARDLRQEVQGTLRAATETLVQSIGAISTGQQARLEDFSGQLSALKTALDAHGAQLRMELASALNAFKESQKQQLDAFATKLQELTGSSEAKADALRRCAGRWTRNCREPWRSGLENPLNW